MAGLAAAIWTILTLWHASAALWLHLEYDAGGGARLRLRVAVADLPPMWEKRLYGPGAPLRPRKGKGLSGRAVWEAVLALSRSGASSARVKARVCTGDAAATAIVCGAIESLNALAARRGIRLSAAPVYEGESARIEAEAKVRAKAGHIALAIGKELLAARARERGGTGRKQE